VKGLPSLVIFVGLFLARMLGKLLVSIGAPVCEELIFRKMLVTRALKYGEGVAILLSGLVFGLFHGDLNQIYVCLWIGIVSGNCFC